MGHRAQRGNALAGFKASVEWTKTVDRAIRASSSYEVQCILVQHYIEGIPLKAIVGKRGKCMSRTTATKYKKIGIMEFANNIFCSRSHLDEMEATLEKSFDYDSYRITTFLCSVQHSPDVEVGDFRHVIESMMIMAACEYGLNGDFQKLVNPTGRFVLGGKLCRLWRDRPETGV